ncbi:nuclease-related domain-containing protein [Lacisediminihabitans sp. FW035]
MTTAVQAGPSSLVSPAEDESPFSGPITTGPLHPGLVLTSPFDSEPFVAAAHTMAPAPAAADRVDDELVAAGRAGTGEDGAPPDHSAPGPAWSIEPNLRARGPAYAVMQECLSRQEAATPRGRLGRALGRTPLHPDARSWYSGALGEIVVANALSQLSDEWTVLHAVPVGSGHSDIDHVILGPGGIYTINTKNHSGQKIWIGGSTFLVNGYKQEHMRESAHEADRASRLLSTITGRPVIVTPLIVVVNPASITTGRKRPRVTVLSSNTLGRWLVRRPRVLSDRAAAHFSMFAEERSTWHTEPVTVDDTTDRLARFEQLRVEVDAARQRARLWLLALGVCAILITPVAIAQIVRLVMSFMVVPV